LNEPVPAHLVDLVMSHGPLPGDVDDRLGSREHVRGTATRTLGVWDRIARALSFEIPVWQSALASSAVILIGVGVATHVSRNDLRNVARPVPVDAPAPVLALDNGNLVAAGRLAQVLETMPSAVAHALEDAGSGRPVATARIRLTFKTQDGYCRQYEVVGTSGERAAEIACRSDEGNWRVRVHAAVAAENGAEKGPMPAGRGGTHIEATVLGSIIGDALNADQETAVIARRWQR
jgi:hypothetical protein